MEDSQLILISESVENFSISKFGKNTERRLYKTSTIRSTFVNLAQDTALEIANIPCCIYALSNDLLILHI